MMTQTPQGSVKGRIKSFLLLIAVFLSSTQFLFSQAPVSGTLFGLKTVESNIDPRGAAITPDGSKALITEWEQSRVRIIDLSNNTHVFATVQARPNDVEVDAQGTYAYVTNFNGNSISRIKLSDNTSIPDYVTSIATVGSIREIVITPDGNKAIVSTNQQWSDASNFVVFIDLVNRTIINRLSVPGGANILAMNASGTKLYTVGVGGTGTVSIIDIATMTVVNSFATATSNVVKGMVLSGDGNTLYTLHNNGYVSAYGSLNTTPSQLWSELLSVSSINTDYFTNSVVIDPNTSRMYVVTHNTTGASDQLLTIDLINKTRLYTNGTGGSTWPNSIGISGNGKKLILSLRRNNQARTYSIPSFPGAGTLANPYQVSSWSQLHSVRDNLSAYYKLMNNLDESSSGYATYSAASANSSSGWLPIGNSSAAFTGSFDGNGFTISGLNINRTSTDDIGLFGQVGAAGSVKNLKIQSASVSGANKVGLLAGALLGTAQNCILSGAVNGVSRVGVISGESNGTIDRCVSKGSATGSASYIGGAVGIISGGTITDSYSHANVTGDTYVGGFSGSASGMLTRLYSAGVVSGNSITGGFTASSTATASKIYWDAESSAQSTSAAGISKNTASIKNYDLFFTDGWDLQCERINGNADTWGVSNSLNNGYPYLSFENLTAGCPEWRPQGNNDFHENLNWVNGFRPSKGMDIVIGNSANRDLLIPENWIVGNVVFNGAGVKVQINDHDLVVLGSISNFNSQNFIQTNGAGKLKRYLINGALFNFPVGNTAYNPVTITNNSGAADSLFVSVRDEVLMKGTSGVSVSGAYVNRTWDIAKFNPNGGSGLNFIFNWNAGEENSPMASPALFHYENNSWAVQTGTTSSTSNSLTYTGYTGSFSPFAVADIASTLAMDLTSFTVTCNNGNNLVKWSVSAPKDVTYLVERSVDLRNWNVISTVNNRNGSDFSVVDENANGLLYYRIRQTDRSGKEFLSSISKSNCGMVQEISVSPVPAASTITVSGITTQTGYSIIGQHGQVMLSGNFNSPQESIDVSALKNGIYYLQTRGQGVTTTRKIIIKK